MTATQRSVAAVVGVLVVLAVVIVAARLLTVEPADVGDGSASAPASASRSAAPSASESPSAPRTETPSPVSSAPTGDEALAVLEQIEAQVEEIRGLEPADIGPPDLITRDELRDELQQIFDEEYPPEERERDNIALRALGLLEPDQDVAELQLQLLGEGVLGFYDDTDKRMVVVTDAGLDAAAKVTYAHEYAHALQDANFGLDTLETDSVGEDDRSLARTALVEGDANVTMIAWLIEHLSQAEQMELAEMPIPDTTGVPSWMIAQLEFPYAAGQFFVSQLAGGDPFAPDFTAVDEAYADPPDSTEQILDFAAWEQNEQPMQVEVPDLVAALGDGWEEVDETPIGEATIAMMLEYFGVLPSDAGAAADGWGGDRAVVVSGPDDAFAVAWRLAWDRPADASQFVAAYEQALDALDFPATVRELPSGEVLVVHASTQEIHDATVDAAD